MDVKEGNKLSFDKDWSYWYDCCWWGIDSMWLLVPTLAKLFDFPNSIPASLGNVSISLPWSQSLLLPSVQFLFV